MRIPLFARWLSVVLVILSIFGLVGLRSYTAQAASANLVWKPYLQQVTDTSAIVLWATQSGSAAMVNYGTSTAYGSTATGSIRTLPTLNYRLNRVKLDGLAPDTTYYYTIRTDGADMLPGETLKFKTAPPAGSDTPVTFLAFGDYGDGTTTQKNLRNQMLNESFDFIVTTGDNAYNSGTYSEFDTKVFQVYRDLFPRGSFFPSPGNHDTYTSSTTPYLDLFDLPANAMRAADRERYYSFDYGSVHVVALDTNSPLDATDADATDDMFDWLLADLSSATEPWKIAVFHSSPYSTGNSHGSDSRAQSKLVPIFEQYGVQLVLSGHDHIYERSKPLRGGQMTTTEQGGVTYIVTGAGSNARYGCGSAAWVAAKACSVTYGIYNRITVTPSTLKAQAVRDNGSVVDTVILANTSSPPPSTLIDLPGRIEAEAYRVGGEGVGYHDTTAGNNGGAYRNDDVDIEVTGDSSGTYNVGWTVTGEWLQYDVNVSTTGTYIFRPRVASRYTGNKIRIEIDGQNVTGALTVPNTGSSQTWTTIASQPVSLQAGAHTIRIVWDTNNVNVNYVDVVATSAPAAISLPGQVEAEDYRAGGEGVGYHDTTAGNTGGAYRRDDVDIQPCSDGAGCYNVGWMAAGEWLQYDVNVSASGSYVWSARVATPYSGKAMRIELDGQNVGSISVPNTGNYQTWATVQSAPVNITAGAHTLRIVFETGSMNLNYVGLAPASS